MLRPEDVVKQHKKQPFEPYRIHLSDGTTCDVKHPDLLIVGERYVVVGQPRPGKNGGVAHTHDTIALMHIVRLEPLQPAPTS
jgi:hypothetical protein